MKILNACDESISPNVMPFPPSQDLIEMEFSEAGRDRAHFPEGWYIVPAILCAVAIAVGVGMALL